MLLRGLVLLAIVSVARGGLVIAFDSGRWVPEPSDELLHRSGHTTALVTAPSGTRMAEFGGLLGTLHWSPVEKVKFQLADQPGSVAVQRAPSLVNGEEEGEPHRIFEGDFVVVTTGLRGTFLQGRSADLEVTDVRMGLNLEGVRKFLRRAGSLASSMKGKDATRHPVLLVAARSDCSFGQFVTVLQLLQEAGFPSFALVVDDELPDADAEVKMDPSAQMGEDGRASKTDAPRIVIRVGADGVVRTEDGTVLDDEVEIRKHVTERKQALERDPGGNPRIHLLGDKDALFKYARRIIRAASKAGVHEVIFMTRSRPVDQVENGDLEMSLPQADPQDAVTRIRPLLVTIDGKGGIAVGGGPMREEMDGAAAGPELPLFRKRLASYCRIVRGHGNEPVVHLIVDDNTPQQRVVEVLNVLAAEKISKVTFSDWIGKDE